MKGPGARNLFEALHWATNLLLRDPIPGLLPLALRIERGNPTRFLRHTP